MWGPGTTTAWSLDIVALLGERSAVGPHQNVRTALMSIHVGFASRRNFLRSATAAQVHADSTLSVTSQPIVVSHARELRARVDQALQAGERHLAVDCTALREAHGRLPWAPIPLAHPRPGKGAGVGFLEPSGAGQAGMRGH